MLLEYNSYNAYGYKEGLRETSKTTLASLRTSGGIRAWASEGSCTYARGLTCAEGWISVSWITRREGGGDEIGGASSHRKRRFSSSSSSSDGDRPNGSERERWGWVGPVLPPQNVGNPVPPSRPPIERGEGELRGSLWP